MFQIDPLAILVNAIKAANTVGLKIQAAKADKSDTVKSILANSEDEKIVAFREGRAKILTQIETLQAKIVNGEAAITEYAQTLIPAVEEGFDLEVATKEFLAKRKEATDARKALLNFVSEEDLAAALKELDVPEIVSVRGSGAAAAAGATGIKRPRISAATIDGEAVFSDEEKTKVDFTTLAKVLKSDANTVKAAAFAAAGTEDLNSLEAGTVVSFSVGDKSLTVTVSGEKPGRKPAEKSETEATPEVTPAA